MKSLRPEAELQAMRASGRLAAEVLHKVAAAVVPGVTTRELDLLARSLITDAGATCSFLGYRGYPAAVCVSINEEVIHGIPGERRVALGDVVSLDVGVCLHGFHGDTRDGYRACVHSSILHPRRIFQPFVGSLRDWTCLGGTAKYPGHIPGNRFLRAGGGQRRRKRRDDPPAAVRKAENRCA